MAVNLLSRSRTKNLNSAARSPRSISKFRACWATQAPAGVGGDSENVDATGGVFHWAAPRFPDC
jgi:hypothetical protein